MTRRSWWMLAAVLVLLAYLVAALFLWNSISRPYEKPAKQTPEETEQVKKALKRHGRITPITTNTRIYFIRDKQEVTILWRG